MRASYTLFPNVLGLKSEICFHAICFQKYGAKLRFDKIGWRDPWSSSNFKFILILKNSDSSKIWVGLLMFKIVREKKHEMLSHHLEISSYKHVKNFQNNMSKNLNWKYLRIDVCMCVRSCALVAFFTEASCLLLLCLCRTGEEPCGLQRWNFWFQPLDSHMWCQCTKSQIFYRIVITWATISIIDYF